MKYVLLYFLVVMFCVFGYKLYLKIRFIFLLVKFWNGYKRIVSYYDKFFNIVSKSNGVSDEILESYEMSREDLEGILNGVRKIVLQNIKEEAEAILDIYEKNLKKLRVYELDFRAENLRKITVNIRRWLWVNNK